MDKKLCTDEKQDMDVLGCCVSSIADGGLRQQDKETNK